MIINISRTKNFQSCRQYSWNWDELGLLSHREADPLVIGEGYHLGSEIISQNADVDSAVKATEQRMRERYAQGMLLPEELPEVERNIEWAKQAVRRWSENYDRADFRVLWPEVNGCVELPNTLHHCWFCHRLLYPDTSFAQCAAALDGGAPTNDNQQSCVRPHFFKFRTDGIIEMYKKVWLLEQKTTSKSGSNTFWKKWNLDFQTRGYCYGVWKTTGVLVSGFLLNAIIKHSKVVTLNGERKYQLDPTNVGFEREPFLVTKEDLLDFEHDLIGLATEYESAFRAKSEDDKTFKIFKNTESCFNWNRECYYFSLCKRGQQQVEGEFRQRTPDYVDLEYYKLLGLPDPSFKHISGIPTTLGDPIADT